MNKILTVILIAASCNTILGNNASKGDVLFNILKQEVNYYFSHLSQDSIPVSFLSFNAMDEKSITITSDMGYSTVEEGNKRQFFPTITYKGFDKTDSFVPLSKWFVCSKDLPLNNDTTVIKDVIWNYLRTIYDETFSGKRRQDANEDNHPSVKAEVYYESPLSNSNLDKEKWKAFLNRLSSIKKDGIRATCKAILNTQIQRQYIVNSEGTAIAQNHTYYWVTLYACVKDKNETDWPIYEQYFAFNESELPDENTLHQAMNNLIDRANALSKAPVAEAYSGPVLFSGEAGGVLFHEVLGHRLERENSEFKPMIGKSVLPSDLSVTGNPALKYINGIAMDGHYLFDDDGAKAQNVECIKYGILKDFLHNIPDNKGDAPSNGHGRAEFGKMTMPRQSNLLVDTSHPCTEEQLREMFIQDLKRSGKEYGYYVHTVTNGRTTNGFDDDRASSFNVFPIETYRVYVDGRPDSLVRGVSFIGTPLAALSNIKAAGGKTGVFNGMCSARSGWVPVTAVSPMLYVSQMETQCVQTRKQKITLLSQPDFIPKEQLDGVNTDSIIFRAMADEMEHCMDSLKAEDGTKPYFMDYVIYRTASDRIESSLGTRKRNDVNGIKYKGKVSLITGDKMRTYRDWDIKLQNLPDEDSYNHIRRELWLASESLFNRLVKYPHNGATRAQEFLDDSIPEWSKLPGGLFMEQSALNNYQKDVETLGVLADTLSAIFKNYPELFDTKVRFNLDYTDVYRVTSDGLRSRTPIKGVRLYAPAEYLAPDGKTYSDSYALGRYDVDELPPTDSLITWIGKMVYRLKHPKKMAITKETDYVGPVLYEGNSAEEELYSALDGRTNIAHYIHSKLNYKDKTYDRMYQQLGERVVNKHISVWQLGNDSVYYGRRLLKYRRYDADGIRPATVELIRDGILENQLAGRIPTPIAKRSTGNEELKGPDHFATTEYENGVLRISFDKTMNRKRLVRKLIELAKKQNLKYAYIVKGNNTIQINTKTGKQENVWLHCKTIPSRLRLLGDMWASKENTADYDNSIIHPQSLLFPLVEMILKPGHPQQCGRFLELRH